MTLVFVTTSTSTNCPSMRNPSPRRSTFLLPPQFGGLEFRRLGDFVEPLGIS
jgi:hypothetical protein